MRLASNKPACPLTSESSNSNYCQVCLEAFLCITSSDAHNDPNRMIYSKRLSLFPVEETQSTERASNLSKSHSRTMVETDMQQYCAEWCGGISERVGMGKLTLPGDLLTCHCVLTVPISQHPLPTAGPNQRGLQLQTWIFMYKIVYATRVRYWQSWKKRS